MVSGPVAQYLFSTAPGRLITTIINNSGATWNGAYRRERSRRGRRRSEYTADTAAACTRAGPS